jgi:hypothetical protein
MKKLLALVPSAGGSGTILTDIEKFYENEVCQKVPVSHILAQGDQRPRRINVKNLDLALKD